MHTQKRWTLAGVVLLATILVDASHASDIVWWGGVNDFWHEAGNWVGGVPGDGDVAWIRHGQTVLLDANTAWIDGLRLKDGAQLKTNDYRLGVSASPAADTLVDGVGTQLLVTSYAADPADRAFDTDTLNVVNEAIFHVHDAVAKIDVSAYIDSSATLYGTGQVQLGSSSTPRGTAVLVNDGKIQGDPIAGLEGPSILTLTAYGGGTLDLDGTGERGVLNVIEPPLGPDGAITLVVDGPLADDFSGTMWIGPSDTIQFNESWATEGARILLSPGSGTATLAGAPWICYESLLQIAITAGEVGVVVIEGDVHFGRSSVFVSQTLQLDGDTIFSSDSTLIGGPDDVLDVNKSLTLYNDSDFSLPELALNDATELNIFGQIDHYQSVIDLDGDGNAIVRIGTDGRLVLLADAIDDDGSGAFNGTLEIAGEFHPTVTGGWTADGDVALVGGLLSGSDVRNDGVVEGYGIINARLVNDGSISADGGTLVINSSSATPNADLDGTAGAGVLEAVDGDLILQEGDISSFNGQLHIGPGRTMSTEGSLEIRSAGPGLLSFNGGTLQTGGDFGLRGTMLVTGSAARIVAGGELSIYSSSSTIDGSLELHGTDDVHFDTGSHVVLNAELRMFSTGGRCYIGRGPTFSGTGAVVVPAGEALTLLNGADVDVHLRNEGTLELGIKLEGEQATAVADSFEQTAGAVLKMTFAGKNRGEFDQLVVAGTAQLDGKFAFSRLPLPGTPQEFYDPQVGDAWPVIKAANVVGEFADFDFDPSIFPIGSYVDLDYQGTEVVVRVLRGFTADFDRDGDVDGDDRAKWQSSFGVNGFADANGDGRSDGADYLIWQRQFGSSVSGSAATADVPEPDALRLLLVSLFLTAWIYRPPGRAGRARRDASRVAYAPHEGRCCWVS